MVLAARHFRVDPKAIRRAGTNLVIPTRLGDKVVPIDRFSGMPIYFASPPATSLGADIQRPGPCRIPGEFCIVSLADLVEGKIPATLLTGRTVLIGYHSVSAVPDDWVTRYAEVLGRAHGLAGVELEKLRAAALLHDYGKIAVRDRFLQKPKSPASSTTPSSPT